MKRFRERTSVQELHLFLGKEKKFEYFLRMLTSATYADRSFAWVARKSGVSLQDLQSAYSDGKRHLALMQAAEQLPEIMNDVANDARSRMAPCSRCYGSGTEAVPPSRQETSDGSDEELQTQDCIECKGAGEVTVPGDKQARDLILKTTGMIGDGGMVLNMDNRSLTINQGQGGDDRIEDLLARTQEIVAAPAPEGALPPAGVVDAELVDDEELT
jgi:hypothetical protein